MENVAYLEVDDFDSNGNLKSYVNNGKSGSPGKSVVLMAQGNYCGYCQQAKPAFEKFAQTTPNIVSATIVTDGEPSEKAAAKFIKKWDPSHKGVPAYFGFAPNGQFKKVHQGSRDTAALKAFAETL